MRRDKCAARDDGRPSRDGNHSAQGHPGPQVVHGVESPRRRPRRRACLNLPSNSCNLTVAIACKVDCRQAQPRPGNAGALAALPIHDVKQRPPVAKAWAGRHVSSFPRCIFDARGFQSRLFVPSFSIVSVPFPFLLLSHLARLIERAALHCLHLPIKGVGERRQAPGCRVRTRFARF